MLDDRDMDDIGVLMVKTPFDSLQSTVRSYVQYRIPTICDLTIKTTRNTDNPLRTLIDVHIEGYY